MIGKPWGCVIIRYMLPGTRVERKTRRLGYSVRVGLRIYGTHLVICDDPMV